MNAFNKVIGYREIKKELMLYCDVMKDPEKYTNLGVRMPRGILIYGRAGLGKTLMASCFVEEARCKSFLVRKERSSSRFVDLIKSVYEKAKASEKAIVFLDDMDKYGNSELGRLNSEEFVTIQSCIDSCSDSCVLTIATINDINNLPKSLLREGRFDKHIVVEEPSSEDFQKIVKHYLSSKKVSKNIEIEEIVRVLEYNSCATLETVINDAGIYAGFEGREYITQKDILNSCVKRIFPIPSNDKTLSCKQLKIAAAHEAGHVLVCEILSPGSVNYAAINTHPDGPGGITKYHKDTETTFGVKAIEHRVMRCLGGKAAVELLYGITDLGAKDDINQAHIVLHEYINTFCLYNYELSDDEYASEFTRENRERRLQYEMERLYAMTKDLLNTKRWALEYFALELYNNKIQTFRDIITMNHVDELRDKSDDHDDLCVYG